MLFRSNVVAALVGFGTFGSFGFLPQLLQTPTSTGYGFGASITESGRVLIPASIVSFVMGFVTPRLMRRFGARHVICAGAVSNIIAFTLIALFHHEKWQLAIWMLFQGMGSGLISSSMVAVVLASVPPQQSGVASGMNVNIRVIGGSLGSAMMAGVITAHLGADGLPVEAAYTAGFLALAAGTVLAVVAALLIPRLPARVERARIAVAEASDDPDVDLVRAQG